MATNMKTIKFGENGETYAVNSPAVSASGELTEAAAKLDFGTFENGLTEVELVSAGVSDGTGDYFHVTINGVRTGFITFNAVYTGVLTMRIKKVGSLWTATGTIAGNMLSYVVELLNKNTVDKITSISIDAYNGAKGFAAGHKYALEGR